MLQNQCMTPHGLLLSVYILGGNLKPFGGILSWISLNFISSLMSFCEPMHSLMSVVGRTVVVATGVSVTACSAGTVVVVAFVATCATGCDCSSRYN